ncbi:MAG: DUF72 domain-containing protein [Nautiliaceae bacterium]
MYIGTSGFVYREWKGKFYPSELPSSKWLDYYVKFFNSLELNSTFYHIPKPSTIKSWKYKTKKYNLKLSIKANKEITHKFPLSAKKANEFLILFDELEEYIGAFLFQFPSSFDYNYEILKNFIEGLNKNYKLAFEFRQKNWYNDKVFELLSKNGISLVWHDFNQPFVMKKTAEFVYLRAHGFEGKYKGSYPDEFLEMFLKADFCYFNNTSDVSAVKDALRLKEMAEKIKREE